MRFFWLVTLCPLVVPNSTVNMAAYLAVRVADNGETGVHRVLALSVFQLFYRSEASHYLLTYTENYLGLYNPYSD